MISLEYQKVEKGQTLRLLKEKTVPKQSRSNSKGKQELNQQGCYVKENQTWFYSST